MLTYQQSFYVAVSTRLPVRDKIRGSIPSRSKKFSVLHNVQTGSGAQPASHSVGTEGSCAGGKAAREWNWPPVMSIYWRY